MRRWRIGAAFRYGALLVAVAVGAWLSGSAQMLAVLVFALLLPVMTALTNQFVCRHLTGQLLLPTTAAKDAACTGTLKIFCDARIPAVRLWCRLSIVNDLTGEYQTMELLTAASRKNPGQQRFLIQSGHCGRLYIRVEMAKLMDGFGVFSTTVPLHISARVTILPELFPCELSISADDAAAGEESVFHRGNDPTEVFQLRTYQRGDDVRRIHWKLSSKLDTLILQELGASERQTLLVFWDKRQAAAPETMDALAEVVASVSRGLCDMGCAFDLGWTEEIPVIRQITDEDALLSAIPALVSRTGGETCLLPMMETYGRVLYIAVRPPREPLGAQVRLLCAESGADGKAVQLFSAEKYKEELERLEIV